MRRADSRERNSLMLTIGAALSALLAGATTTLFFLWFYTLDVYKRAFYNRGLPALSSSFKAFFWVLASLVWFAIISKLLLRPLLSGKSSLEG